MKAEDNIGGPDYTPSVPGMQETDRGGTRPSMCGDGGLGYTPAVPITWPDPLWQRECWDTHLRRGESYSQKWEYARNNPVRAGLCATPEDWPFQGEMNVLMWLN